jgi:Zn-finger nucleic acid-binding protein
MSRFNVSALACPRCEAAVRAAGKGVAPRLFAGVAAGMTLHGCGACGGVFLGQACARRLAEATPPEAVELAHRASASARYAPDLSAPLACPVCQGTMRRTHALRAGVELDACVTHGTWYDRDELRRVAEAIRASRGGFSQVATVAAPAVMPGSSGGETALDVVSDLALSGAAELALEGVVGILGAIFE